MKCRECPDGKRFASGSVYCITYGMIIREEYRCLAERRKRHESVGGTADLRHGSEDETGLHTDGSGFAGPVPEFLPGSGERKSLSGMEGREEGGNGESCQRIKRKEEWRKEHGETDQAAG
jgi:hypothetical protein